jgi:hypothetical protein
MKYLILREADGAEFPFLFCSPFTHLEVGLMLQGHRHGRSIVAAGFVEWFAGQPAGPGAVPQVLPRCFGRSESLNLDSRPGHDSATLAAFYSATLTSARALYTPAA